MNIKKLSQIFGSLVSSIVFLIGLLVFLAGNSQAALAGNGDLFVSPGGGGDCSQASPCDLQTALGTALDGDRIYLAAGTYTGSGDAVVTLSHSVSLYGGWDGSPTTPPDCDHEVYSSIIDGQDGRRGVFVGSGLSVTLEGLSITNGVDDLKGAGLYAGDAHLTLRHLSVYSNTIDVNAVPGSYAYGGGAMVEGGSLVVEASSFWNNSVWGKIGSNGGGLMISDTVTATVSKALFQDNDAWSGSGLSFLGVSGHQNRLVLRQSTFAGNGWGRSRGLATGGYAGGIAVSRAIVEIEENTFIDNWASNEYGALSISSSELLLARNWIYQNQSGRSSGLYISSFLPFTITNNVIADNQSTYTWMLEPAVLIRYGNGQFLHNTIARNSGPYGILLENGASVAFTNTILVSHTLGISVTAGSTAALEGTLWGSGSWANGTDWGGDGTIQTGTLNLWDEPRFLNPEAGDYHLRQTSAAVDAGLDAGVLTDIDGDPRPTGAGFDIGADEFMGRLYLPLLTSGS